jgi:hypothetical protein
MKTPILKNQDIVNGAPVCPFHPDKPLQDRELPDGVCGECKRQGRGKEAYVPQAQRKPIIPAFSQRVSSTPSGFSHALHYNDSGCDLVVAEGVEQNED